MRSRLPLYLAAAVLAGALSHSTALRKQTAELSAPAPSEVATPRVTAIQELCRQLGESNDACLAGLDKKQTVRFLIATVADPKRTNLGLYFDRSVEALIWAVGDAGYSFRSYWLPWPTENQSAPASVAERGQPGFLLFRRSVPDDFLVVWLVGESPTVGVERLALSTAMANTRQYNANATLQILGPSFSGSFLSLGDAIQKDAGTGQIRVVTGMATSQDAQNEFIERLGSKVSFGATVENSSRAFCRFIDYLHQERPAKNEIAILAEDQTVYGQQTETIPCLKGDSANERWLLVRFPREIARLRNSSETPANTIAGNNATSAPASQSLPFTLRSPAPDQELPVFSGEQSPLSQEAALLDLANALQNEHVRYAAIAATDVLDQIFLARFLHHACPDVRLIVFDADLLFARAESTNTLEGVLSVSTYPLFLRNQHWTSQELKGQLPRRVPFASRSAEGTYNAARELLWEAGLRAPGEVMLEYRDPYHEASRHPPLWLSVLGRTGYWPVALLPEKEDAFSADGGIKSSLLDGPPANQPSEILHPESPSHAWRLVVILISILSCFHCAFILLVYNRQLTKAPMWEAKAPRLAAVFVYRMLWTYPRIARGEFNRLLISVTLALAAAEAVFAASGVPYAISTAPDTESPLFWFLILPSACFVWLTVTAMHLTRHAKARWTVVGEWVIFAAFLALWGASLQWFLPGHMVAFFFAYRTVHPASGVSPGLPVLLLIAVWFLWGFFQLWRRAGVAPPEVPALDEPRLHAARLDAWIPQPFPLGALPFLALLIFWTFVRLRSVENGWYDDLITLLVLVGYFLMFSVWGQLLFGWRYFRRFLEALERHAIRDAFSKLPKELATLPLLNRGRQRPYLMATARCCDTLTAIVNDETIAKHAELKEAYEKRQLAIRTRVKGLLHLLSREKGTELYQARKIASIKTQLERAVLHTTNTLIDDARTRFWRGGTSDSLSAASDKREKPGPLGPDEKLRILAEEIIALRFTMYIVYTIDQMKKLTWFVVISFVLIIVALNIYPFESPRIIDLTSIAIFVAISVGTAMVLAQMDRDAILSRLTDTNPNQISRNFFLHVARFGALPLITVLSTEFPSIRNFLFSWIQPALQALGTSG